MDVTEVGWTTKQLDELRTMNGAETLDMLQRKADGGELPTVDGDLVTDPCKLPRTLTTLICVCSASWVGAVMMLPADTQPVFSPEGGYALLRLNEQPGEDETAGPRGD